MRDEPGFVQSFGSFAVGVASVVAAIAFFVGLIKGNTGGHALEWALAVVAAYVIALAPAAYAGYGALCVIWVLAFPFVRRHATSLRVSIAKVIALLTDLVVTVGGLGVAMYFGTSVAHDLITDIRPMWIRIAIRAVTLVVALLMGWLVWTLFGPGSGASPRLPRPPGGRAVTSAG